MRASRRRWGWSCSQRGRVRPARWSSGRSGWPAGRPRTSAPSATPSWWAERCTWPAGPATTRTGSSGRRRRGGARGAGPDQGRPRPGRHDHGRPRHVQVFCTDVKLYDSFNGVYPDVLQEVPGPRVHRRPAPPRRRAGSRCRGSPRSGSEPGRIAERQAEGETYGARWAPSIRSIPRSAGPGSRGASSSSTAQRGLGDHPARLGVEGTADGQDALEGAARAPEARLPRRHPDGAGAPGHWAGRPPPCRGKRIRVPG